MTTETAIFVPKRSFGATFALPSVLILLMMILADCDGDPVGMAARAILGG